VKLRYTSSALADLTEILDYIQAYSPHAARRVQSRIQRITDLLLTYPHCVRTDDPSVRRLATAPHPYLIFYEATVTEIIVIAVRHGARSPDGMPGAAKNIGE
jgi:toxin ParE1/3/4